MAAISRAPSLPLACGDPVARPTWVWRAAYAFVRGFLLRFFWNWKVSGLENIPERGPVILASNHIGWFDGPLLVVAAGPRRYLQFLAKIELYRIPVLGWFLRMTGIMPLDRGKGDTQAIRSAIDLVRSGGMLGLFPEGTRAKGGVPRRPKPGVGLLARETGAPVVLARVIDTDKFLRFHDFEIRFGPAVRFPAGGDGGRAECQAFAESVMKRICEIN